MKKWATVPVSLALVAFLAQPAQAAMSLDTSSRATAARVAADVPPAAPGASGAIIRDESCFENQLWDGSGALGPVDPVKIDLPFTIYGSGKYWDDIWVSPEGALSHDEGGNYASGMDVIDEDMLRSNEVYMPMFGGYSMWSGGVDDGYEPSRAYYGYTIFDKHQALCVTWLDITPMIPQGPPEWVVTDPYSGMGYWRNPGTMNDPTRPNSYQALIVDRSDLGYGIFEIVFNYDSITWQYEFNGIDFYTGQPVYSYSEAGWSRGIPGERYEFVWRGMADGRLDDDGEPSVLPEYALPYPQDHWFPQHDESGGHENLLDSSPDGLANTSTGSSQLGRHRFTMAGPRWHLALVLDGRSSLTPEEYAAEIDAIVAGLDDEDAFPREEQFGISVTVVGRYRDPDTYAWGDALTLIPEWTIFSDATVELLQSKLRALPQATSDGGTDRVGLGVAVTHTESFLGDNALRSVCQVTFDQPSTGLATDLDDFGSTGAVDRVDLIGVGGHPGGNTGSSAAEHDIDAHLFGGNHYRYVASSAELADEWAGHCSKRLPLIRGIEVNQAIQNLHNDVPLVANRDTAVRVYVEKTFSTDPDPYLTGALTARNAVAPWDPLNPPYQDPIRFPTIALTTDVFDSNVRSNPDGDMVLDFKLPIEWTTGDILLSLEMNQPPYDDPLGGVTCMWPHEYPAGPCEIRATYTESPPLAIDLYVLSMGGQAPTDAEVAEQLDRVTRQFPIATKTGLDVQMYRGPYRDPSPLSIEVLWSLQGRRDLAQSRSNGAKPYLYALTNPKDYDLQGMGSFGVGVSDISSWQNEGVAEGTGQWRNVMPHELGHALGLDHNLGSPSGAGWPPGLQMDLCRAISLPWLHYPGWTGEAVFLADDGGGRPPRVVLPTISSFSSSAGFAWRDYEGQRVRGTSGTPVSVFEEYWGVDTRYIESDNARLAYSDPRETGELMSYVNGPSRCTIDLSAKKGQGYWVSPESYAYLRDHLVPQTGARTEAPGDHVAGAMSVDAGGTQVDLGPMIDVPYINTSRSNTFGYVLNLYSDAGEMIGSVTPDVDFALSEGEGEDSTLYGFFVADFPRQDVARMDLVQDGVVLGTNVASAATPVVEITSPVAGANVVGDTVQLAWTASDADGDALEFDVLYSPDGLDWDTLEVGLTGTSVAIDRSQIAGSDSGQFLVIANDGFNSSTDSVGGLEVAGNAPWLLIGDPIDGSSFAGDARIPFSAWVSDREDGAIPFDSISWASSLDGPIDTSAAGGVVASDLALGVHRITATVTDSDGNVTTASTTITITDDEATNTGNPVGGSSGGATPEPSVSPSSTVAPTPSPASTPASTVATTPTPQPSPTTVAVGSGGEGSALWLWVIGIVLLLLIIAVLASAWLRDRPSR